MAEFDGVWGCGMNTLEILKAGRAVIADVKHFTKGEFARNFNGGSTDADGPYACQFCSLGAINSLKNLNPFDRREAIKYFEDFLGQLVEVFNDGNPHAVVIAGWDRAIANLEAAA